MIRQFNAEGRPGQKRVPDCDIVDVGVVPDGEPLQLRESDLARSVRHETVVHLSDRPPARRNRTRLLTALLILELGFLGAVYVGKRYAQTEVIVVPATGNPRSVITWLVQ
jgi:hypothetical protein